MVTLTQVEREELTAFLTATIEKRCTVYTIAKQSELEALRDKVAIASIMAEPLSEEASESLISMVSYALSRRLCMGMDEGFKSSSPEVEHDFVKEIRRFITCGGHFYTAPPVQEIRFPDVPEGELVYSTAYDTFGEEGCMMITKHELEAFIAETKRINCSGGGKMCNFISVEIALPHSKDGQWSEEVIALCDNGCVFKLCCMGSYWQRSSAFIESGARRVTHWIPIPSDYAK